MTFGNDLMVKRAGCGFQCALLALLLTAWAGAIIAAPTAPTPQALALIESLGLPASPIASRDLPGWKAPTQIAVAYADAARLAQLQTVVPDVRVRALDRQAPLAPQLADVQAVIGVCSAEVLAAASADVQGERYWIVVVENLRRYVAGEPLLNVVDIQRGSSSA